MTIRNGFRRLPPFVFSDHARPANIPCKPVVTPRGSAPETYFVEVATAPGPHTIGATGDNSYGTLFGREWLVVWCEDDLKLHAFQEDHVTRGVWHAVTSPLPPVFDSALPITARRVSFAFDQSARMIVAYEDEGVVKVTRWDPGSSSYVQNVSFSGVDPVVVMDASWAYDIPNSDALLFYLSSDREKVMCRVQREIYAVEHEMHDYGAAVILDRATPTFLRYELLVSDLVGDSLEDVLLSDPYPYLFTEPLFTLGVGPAVGDYQRVVLVNVLAEGLPVSSAGPTSGAYTDPILYAGTADALSSDASGPDSGSYDEAILNHALDSGLDVTGVAPESGALVSVVLKTSLAEALTSTATGPDGGTYAAI